mmetsp:Transcript_17359/g.56822  ORF Transcript_17359/g.56822 Transcript_17359/m.56822 type:complete len:382 (-) Transcript_17359:245-1390(-)
MERWASSAAFGGLATFMCISVDADPEGTCRMFQQMFHLKASVNVFVAPGAGPQFPAQLGCQGFVILDAGGRLVTTCTTPAFLQAGPGAFRAVEASLARVAPALATISGVAAEPELNGMRVEVLPGVEVPEGRVAVRLTDGRVVALKAENVTRDAVTTAVPDACGAPACGACACGDAGAASAPPVAVELHGLAKAELNGRRGEVRREQQAGVEPGRVAVSLLPDGPTVAVREENVREAVTTTTRFDENACDTKAELPLTLPSVGHERMDAEHAELERAMGVLRSAGSPGERRRELEALRKLFAEHSEHEEELMERVGFGRGASAAFSAAASHAEDHRRILALAESALDGSCSGEAAHEVIGAVLTHAAKFDALYETAVAGAA